MENITVGIIKNDSNNILYGEINPKAFDKIVRDIEDGEKVNIIELPKPIDDIRLICANGEPKTLVLICKNNKYEGFSQEAYKRLNDSNIDVFEILELINKTRYKR